MGFLASSIQVRARYRRCRRDWAPHLAQTSRVILDALGSCRSHRKVVVFGAGLLHDIPLEALAEAFERVVLVDIVHPWLTRVAARRFRNVELIAADATEVMDRVRSVAHVPGAELPVSYPMRFTDDSELDLTLSVNLLSQLPQVPANYLDGLRDEPTIEAFLKGLIEAHLDYLRRLPGHTALITDILGRRVSQAGGLIEEWDPLHGVGLPRADRTWEWHLAPSPEVARGVDLFTTVAAFHDWKAAAARRVLVPSPSGRGLG